MSQTNSSSFTPSRQRGQHLKFDHKLRGLGWSIDEFVGRAKLPDLFSDDEIVCTKTLYNAVHAQNIAICLFDLPEAISRRPVKRLSIQVYSENDILSFADSMNDSPRRVLRYRTPNEMFEKQLDRIYALKF